MVTTPVLFEAVARDLSPLLLTVNRSRGSIGLLSCALPLPSCAREALSLALFLVLLERFDLSSKIVEISSSNHVLQTPFQGWMMVVVMALLSGFAGLYTEAIIKKHPQRNINVMFLGWPSMPS